MIKSIRLNNFHGSCRFSRPIHSTRMIHEQEQVPAYIKNFLNREKRPIKIQIPRSHSSTTTSIPTDPEKKSDFTDCSASYRDHDNFLKHSPVPVHTQSSQLPQIPSDIKGVDEAVYMHLRKPKVTRTMPKVYHNSYFSLKFFPHDHHISKFRKSNISYTFSNRGGYKLNNKMLEDSLAKYKGKYRSSNYFRENLQPLYTAFGRTTYRKFIKRCLFESLHKFIKNKQDIQKVAGVFRFTFNLVPGSQEERQLMRDDIDKSVKKIISASFRKELKEATMAGNALKNEIQALERQVSLYNTLGEWQVPGYIPKLPFIGREPNAPRSRGSKKHVPPKC